MAIGGRRTAFLGFADNSYPTSFNGTQGQWNTRPPVKAWPCRSGPGGDRHQFNESKWRKYQPCVRVAEWRRNIPLGGQRHAERLEKPSGNLDGKAPKWHNPEVFTIKERAERKKWTIMKLFYDSYVDTLSESTRITFMFSTITFSVGGWGYYPFTFLFFDNLTVDFFWMPAWDCASSGFR